MKLLDVTNLIICVTIMRDLKSYMSFMMIQLLFFAFMLSGT